MLVGRINTSAPRSQLIPHLGHQEQPWPGGAVWARIPRKSRGSFPDSFMCWESAPGLLSWWALPSSDHPGIEGPWKPAENKGIPVICQIHTHSCTDGRTSIWGHVLTQFTTWNFMFCVFRTPRRSYTILMEQSPTSNSEVPREEKIIKVH